MLKKLSSVVAIALLSPLFSAAQNPPNGTCGSVLQFDGISKKITLDEALDIGSSSNTIEAWVRVPPPNTVLGLGQTETVGVIFGNIVSGPASNWEVDKSGRLVVKWNGSSVFLTGTTDIRDSIWHHVAFVRNREEDSYKVYLDGVEEISHGDAGSDVTFTVPHRIGADATSATKEFHGWIDELRVWSDARSQAEIQANMNIQLQGSEDDLEHYYNFNEGTGEMLIDKTGGNHGTLSAFVPSDWQGHDGSPPCLVSPPNEQCGTVLNFDGTDDLVSVVFHNDLNPAAFTLSTWVKVTGGPNTKRVIYASQQSASGFSLFVNANNKWAFEIGDGITTNTLESQIVITQDKWHHITATYDGSNTKLFVNDDAVDSATGIVHIPNTANGVVFGAEFVALLPASYFIGQLDHVSFWNRALTTAEVAAIADSTFTGLEAGLKAFWPFDDGTGDSVVTDLSGNSFHGNFLGIDPASAWTNAEGLPGGNYVVTVQENACDSFVSPSMNYTWNTSGTFRDTLLGGTVDGCDSIIVFELTVFNATRDTFPQTTCDSLTSPSGRHTWHANGLYPDTLFGQNSEGCDSMIWINLTVQSSSQDTFNIDTCGPYALPSGGAFLTQSGAYWDTLAGANANGCDSILLINLTLQSSRDTIQAEACASYTSPDGQEQWTETGLYADTLVGANANGCDSMVWVNLTIQSSSHSFQVDVCDSYQLPGGATVTTSGTYRDTLTGANADGCDSIVEVMVNIATIDTAVTASSSQLAANSTTGVTYRWLDCNNGFSAVPLATSRTYAGASGSFAVELTSTQANCVDTSSCYAFENPTSTGLLELISEGAITVFPNPSASQFELRVQEDLDITLVQVHNVVGQEIEAHAFGNITSISIGDQWPTGVYRLHFFNAEGESAVLEVIKQ